MSGFQRRTEQPVLAAHETHTDEALLDWNPVSLHVGRAQRGADARLIPYATADTAVSAATARHRRTPHRGASGALREHVSVSETGRSPSLFH